jgi:hypothetical protein
MLIPFSAATLFARGDANTLPPAVEVEVEVEVLVD